jgi:hypothetical protein
MVLNTFFRQPRSKINHQIMSSTAMIVMLNLPRLLETVLGNLAEPVFEVVLQDTLDLASCMMWIWEKPLAAACH